MRFELSAQVKWSSGRAEAVPRICKYMAWVGPNGRLEPVSKVCFPLRRKVSINLIRATALLLGLGNSIPAMAQSAPPLPPPVPVIDRNFVSITGYYNDIPYQILKIGPQKNGGLMVSFSSKQGADSANNIWADLRIHRMFTTPGDSSTATDIANLSLFGQSDTHISNLSGIFAGSSSQFGNGSRFIGAYGAPVYERSDGTKLYFIPQLGQNSTGDIILYYYIDKMEFPNGETWRWSYSFLAVPGLPVSPRNTFGRIVSITNNLGYQIKLGYTPSSTWIVTGREYTAINNAYEYCSPTIACSLALSWPKVTQVISGPTATQTRTFTASPGRVVSARQVSATVEAFRPQTATSENITYTSAAATDPTSIDCATGNSIRQIKSATIAGENWTYARNDNGCSFASRTLTVTDPQSKQTVYTYKPEMPGFSPWPGQPATLTSVKDPLNRVTQFEFDGFYRKKKIIEPALSSWEFAYDARGNQTSVTRNPVPGSGLAVQTLELRTFPATCANYKICNQPTSITDARGNVTDFTYSADHGGVLSKAGPAVNGIRPVVRYEYAQRYAWLKNASGAYVQATTPVWLLISERMCRTTATVGSACAGGAADEVVTSYDYGPNSGPNNLILRGTVVTADGQSLRTCFGLDRFGNKISETKPAANLTTCN
jgi:hypothetical protein